MAAFVGALTAAIPVIDKIVKTIFPGNKDKTTKKEANNAVLPEKSASSTALKAVSSELSLIATLLEYCLPAEDGIVAMKAILEANRGGLSPSDKLMIRKSWKIVMSNLGKVRGKDTVKAVNDISDEFTKSTFLDVINGDTDSIGQDIEGSGAWPLPTLTEDVKQLYVFLNKVNKVGARVVGGIANEIEKLSMAQSKKPA